MSRQLPLARHAVLRTTEPLEAAAAIGRLFVPHRLTVRPGKEFEARQHTARFGPVALCYQSYGAEVEIAPHFLSGFFMLHIPLAGAASATEGRTAVEAIPDRSAVMVSPGQDVTLRWGAGTPHLLVWFDSDALESSLARMLGRRPKRRLRFDIGVDLTAPAVRRWYDLMRLVQAELEGEREISRHPVAARNLQELAMTGLLTSARHSHSGLLHDGDPAATMRPARIRRAVDLIEDHAAEPLTVEDIADAVGASVRVLQRGFRAHLDTTPTAYLRDVRLKRARAELVAGSPESGTSITEVALRWGFAHLSRFAQAYRAMFGETPSATLRAGYVSGIPRSPRG